MEIGDAFAYGLVIAMMTMASIVIFRRCLIDRLRDVWFRIIFYVLLLTSFVILLGIHWYNTALWITIIWSIEYLAGMAPRGLNKPTYFVGTNLLGLFIAWGIERFREVSEATHYLWIGFIGGIGLGYIAMYALLTTLFGIPEQKKR